MAAVSHDRSSRPKRGELAPVYLVLGDDHLARRQGLEMIRKQARVLGASDLAFRSVHAGDVDLVDVLDGARTLPMGGGRRFIALLGAEVLGAEELSSLAEYAENPLESSCLVVEAATLPGRSAAVRRLLKAAVVMDCTAPRSFQIPRWIEAEIRRRGYTSEAMVPKQLQGLMGDDRALLSSALDKVELYKGDSGTRHIRVQDLLAVLTMVPHGTVWNFVEALEEKEVGRALNGLQAVLDQGETPESLLRLILRSRRQLLMGLAVRRRGGSDDEALEEMGVSPRARAAPRLRRAILSRLSRHRMGELVASFPRLLQAESEIKGGSQSDRVTLSRLVLDLAGP